MDSGPSLPDAPSAAWASPHRQVHLHDLQARFAETRPLLQWAQALDGLDAPWHRAAVRALLATGGPAQAEELLWASVEAAPHDVLLRALLVAVLWARGDLAHALEELARLATRFPLAPELLGLRERWLATVDGAPGALAHVE